jgi:hypothetical protein
MARGAGDLLSDAREVSRRNAIPFLVIAAGLLLVWATTLEDARRGFRADERALFASWIKAEKTRAVIESIGAKRSQLSGIIEKARGEAESSCRVPGEAGCRMAREKLVAAQKRDSHLEARLNEFRKIEGELAQSIRQIRSRLAEKVSFEVGQGIRLPFTLLFAPLAWLLVLAFLLVRLTMVRALFWRLVMQSEVRRRLDGLPPPGTVLVDTPFWLGPVPRASKDGSHQATLRRIVGWRTSATFKRMLLYATLTGAAVVCLRVCWLGIFFESVSRLPNEILGDLGQQREDEAGSPSWPLLGLATALAAILDTVLLLSRFLPGRGALRATAPVPDGFGRREMIALGVGAVGYTFLALQLSRTTIGGDRGRLFSRLSERMLRFRRRNNGGRQVLAAKLAPGWYANKRTSAVHLVREHRKIRAVGGPSLAAAKIAGEAPAPAPAPAPAAEAVAGSARGPESASRIIHNARGLKPANLEPAPPEGVNIDAPAFWVRKEYATAVREEIALSSLRKGEVWLAMNVLVFAIPIAPEGAGTALRKLDLAAGMVLWLGWGKGLAQVSEAARRLASSSRSPVLRDLLLARVERWNEPSGAKWRSGRWNPGHPFRWNRQKIKRSEIGRLALEDWQGEAP